MDSALCPHCHAPRNPGPECLRCGVIYARAKVRTEEVEPLPPPPPAPVYAPVVEVAPVSWEPDSEDAALERRLRLLALPVALAVSWVLVRPGFLHSLVRIALSMPVHETGHAITAWLCGFLAFPLPWLTPTASERSILVVLALAAALVFGLRWSWQRRRPVPAVLCAALLVLQVVGTLLLRSEKAQAVIIFMGDGGCFVLGALLMSTFYARSDSDLRTGWLRWGFLAIGAAAFADAGELWWAARCNIDRIPFGENEGVTTSDPTKLTEDFGWSVTQLVHRYTTLELACGAALLLLYLWGLRPAKAAKPPLATGTSRG